MLTKIGIILDYMVRSLAVLAGVLIVASMLGVCLDISMRAFFNLPQVWVQEICEYALIVITMLAMAWLVKVDGHIKIDLLTGRLCLRAKILLNAVTSLLGSVACMVAAWYSAQVAWDLFQRGVVTPGEMGLPKYPLIAVICVCLFVVSIEFIRKAVGWLAKWRGKPEPEKEMEINIEGSEL